jgi:hypothetical protein
MHRIHKIKIGFKHIQHGVRHTTREQVLFEFENVTGGPAVKFGLGFKLKVGRSSTHTFEQKHGTHVCVGSEE